MKLRKNKNDKIIIELSYEDFMNIWNSYRNNLKNQFDENVSNEYISELFETWKKLDDIEKDLE